MNNLPTITDRTFGIEMEFEGADIREVARTLNQVVECHFEGYTHTVLDYWKIVTDGSLPNYDTCGEIVSPILKGQEGIEQLAKVCEALDTIEGIHVTRRCGLHIHLGVEDLTVGQIQTVYERYADYESQIDLVMPRSRRRSNAHWCGSITGSKNRVKRATTKRRLAGSAGTRYLKVNLESLARYGTIEFRQHSGTLNFTKIVNWLSFLMAFVEKSVALTPANRRRSVSKNRPYNLTRTLIENNGYEIEYSRQYNGWIVTGDGISTALEVLLFNCDLNTFYDTARENSLDRVSLVAWLERKGLNITFVDFENITTEEETVSETDSGWLDGVDLKVKSYFEEREDELN
tara:strand:- start:3774 stop:4811 length:1038 start_codon:yes stop_codon:yes gene_type:complete